MLDNARDIQSDVSAHSHAMSIPIGQVVEELVDILGATTVAVIGGVKETRAVQQWCQGREPQRAHVLRFALQLAQMIAGSANHEFAVAWFHGSNPSVDDDVPMLMLANRPLSEVQAPLVRAARAFATSQATG